MAKFILTLVAFFSVASIAAAAENLIFNELVTRGVRMANVAVQLPSPTLPDGLTASQQQAALATIADENHPLPALLRKSIVAPQILQIKEERAVGNVRSRRVDVWFIAYGDINRLSDEAFVREQAKAEIAGSDEAGSDEGRVLTDTELKKRGISLNPQEQLLAARFTLFDRVQISGGMRSLLTRTSDSVTVAGIMDQRFARDAEFPNSWRAITRDEAGRTSLGRPQVYDSVGWYAKATKLTNPPGAALVEVHAVFDEPSGWFNGANLLRSKLPILVQDSVRKFRRRLSAAE